MNNERVYKMKVHWLDKLEDEQNPVRCKWSDVNNIQKMGKNK
jgi:hypothetical protein